MIRTDPRTATFLAVLGTLGALYEYLAMLNHSVSLTPSCMPRPQLPVRLGLSALDGCGSKQNGNFKWGALANGNMENLQLWLNFEPYPHLFCEVCVLFTPKLGKEGFLRRSVGHGSSLA